MTAHDTSHETSQNWVTVAKVTGAHGLRGEVSLWTFTENPADVAAYGDVVDLATQRSFKITDVRPAKKGVIARLTGIADRTAAEQVKGLELSVPRSRLPAPDDDEFYYDDLIGLIVSDALHGAVGTIVSVHDFGAGDLLEVRPPTSRKSFFIPFTKEYVPHLDLAARTLETALPQDYFDVGKTPSVSNAGAVCPAEDDGTNGG